jgi:hypothetical protein
MIATFSKPRMNWRNLGVPVSCGWYAQVVSLAKQATEDTPTLSAFSKPRSVSRRERQFAPAIGFDPHAMVALLDITRARLAFPTKTIRTVKSRGLRQRGRRLRW